MKRIIYQVVIAKTSKDNELMNYKTVFTSPLETSAHTFASKYRKEHPGYAFIVAEKRHETNNTQWGFAWELDHDAGGEEVLEHY